MKRLTFLPILLVFAACASTRPAIPQAWLSVPEAPRMRSLSFDQGGKVVHTPAAPPRRTSDGPVTLTGEFTGPRLMNGPKPLAGPYPAIDSFSYSQFRGEVAFSAKREKDFDIGLVSSDGSPIKWVPNDPADEVSVQWAPKGSRISYVVRAFGGDIVRTVHIPTSAEWGNPFENGTVHAVAWEPSAEGYAVAYSTPEASDRIEVMKYDGADRRMIVPPVVRLDVSVEPFAPGAVILRRNDLRYDEKLPLVVWRAADFAWSDARAALMNGARVAMVITNREPSAELWQAAQATPWIDAGRSFLVGAECTCPATQIAGDPALAPGELRRSRNVVRVAPAVVQSVAAGFIADQLKRTSATNGSSR